MGSMVVALIDTVMLEEVVERADVLVVVVAVQDAAERDLERIYCLTAGQVVEHYKVTGHVEPVAARYFGL